MAHFPVVDEKKARKLIDSRKNIVFVHTKSTCPVCDVFVPNVLVPISKDKKYSGIDFYEITESLTFPVGAHPVTYFFREGLCTQHPAGAAPEEAVRTMLDTMYLGKLAPMLDIRTS